MPRTSHKTFTPEPGDAIVWSGLYEFDLILHVKDCGDVFEFIVLSIKCNGFDGDHTEVVQHYNLNKSKTKAWCAEVISPWVGASLPCIIKNPSARSSGVEEVVSDDHQA